MMWNTVDTNVFTNHHDGDLMYLFIMNITKIIILLRATRNNLHYLYKCNVVNVKYRKRYIKII